MAKAAKPTVLVTSSTDTFHHGARIQTALRTGNPGAEIVHWSLSSYGPEVAQQHLADAARLLGRETTRALVIVNGRTDQALAHDDIHLTDAATAVHFGAAVFATYLPQVRPNDFPVLGGEAQTTLFLHAMRAQQYDPAAVSAALMAQG